MVDLVPALGPAPRLTAEPPRAIAHRGGVGLGVENTLTTFGRAHALGIRDLETDVQATADGALVCVHDPTLRRLADPATAGARLAGRAVERLTLAQLRSIPLRGGERICTLEEALLAHPGARFVVDVKTSGAIQPLIRLIHDLDCGERFSVAGAWDGWLEQICRAAPSVDRALGWRSLASLIGCTQVGVRAPRWVATARWAHVPLSVGRMPVVLDRLITSAHRIGVRVNVWTVNETAMMNRLLDLGADGIITDRPDLLRGALIARDEWLPLGAA